jgi:hypothetical protein
MRCLDVIEREPCLKIEGARVGRLLGLDGDGSPLVDFDDNPAGPVAARAAVPGLSPPAVLAAAEAVVLVFENGDYQRPLIVGVISNSRHSHEVPKRSAASGNIEVEIDGRTVSLEAVEQVTLRCGAASLTLRKDGRILLLGTDVTTRATRVNKIKGGAVQIN